MLVEKMEGNRSGRGSRYHLISKNTFVPDRSQGRNEVQCIWDQGSRVRDSQPRVSQTVGSGSAVFLWNQGSKFSNVLGIRDQNFQRF